MSTYMTLEEYAATLKVGDEVTIKYYSITGEKEIKEKILKITKSGTIYLRSTNCKDALRFRKNGHWIELEPDKYGNFIQCSVCDSKFGLYSKDNYCQACGAIMDI